MPPANPRPTPGSNDLKRTDTCQTPKEKNEALAKLLLNEWNGKDIDTIQRDDGQSAWLAWTK